MEEPNFWDNPEEAQEQMKQLSSMKEDRDTYQKLVSTRMTGRLVGISITSMP